MGAVVRVYNLFIVGHAATPFSCLGKWQWPGMKSLTKQLLFSSLACIWCTVAVALRTVPGDGNGELAALRSCSLFLRFLPRMKILVMHLPSALLAIEQPSLQNH
jgi:hypothetical protein